MSSCIPMHWLICFKPGSASEIGSEPAINRDRWLAGSSTPRSPVAKVQGACDACDEASHREPAARRGAGTTSEAVLGRPGALPKLLGAAADAAHPAAPGLADAIQSSITMARLPRALSFDDMSAVLAQASRLPKDSDTQGGHKEAGRRDAVRPMQSSGHSYRPQPATLRVDSVIAARDERWQGGRRRGLCHGCALRRCLLTRQVEGTRRGALAQLARAAAPTAGWRRKALWLSSPLPVPPTAGGRRERPAGAAGGGEDAGPGSGGVRAELWQAGGGGGGAGACAPGCRNLQPAA